MIGGTIVVGSPAQKVIMRAIGPSLAVERHLEDPVLNLLDANGALVASNNNWQTSQEAEITAIVTFLPPAAYTAIMRGVNSSTGVALFEVYALVSDSVPD